MKTRSICALLGISLALAGCKTSPPQTESAPASPTPTVGAAPAPAPAPSQAPTAQVPARNCTYLPGYEPKQVTSTQNVLIGAALGALAGGVIGRNSADKKSVGTRNGVLAGALLGALAGSQFKDQVKVTEGDDGSVKMNIPGSVLFPTGSAALNPQFRLTLDGVTKVLNQYCDVSALVVGHTDNTGSLATNERLSLQRATSVIDHMGVSFPRARMMAEGRADREPVASNADAAGRQQNRRVEIFIKPPAQ